MAQLGGASRESTLKRIRNHNETETGHSLSRSPYKPIQRYTPGGSQLTAGSPSNDTNGSRLAI